ncbi:kinase-like domain-containing protein [Dipodascopsis tothii]|uniref:kinase-like domain-containing protein n=1 Tax=Dipodascopsis tothii TaxID=44089 RepID=UPI0034CF3EA0
MGNSSGKESSGEIALNHFRLLRVVGKGSFGKVRIVEHKATRQTYALKYIAKDEIVKSDSVKNIIRERNILEKIKHPFICNLRYSFQDAEFLFIVVDLMTGGDLRFHISRKTIHEDAIRFWIAEAACALDYIHRQQIVHRDVKPDNILLDSQGHVSLADFNVAAKYQPGQLLYGKSGTLSYLPPEVFANTGYDATLDWWSLGVVMYECCYNRRPFPANSQSELVEQVMHAEPVFPPTVSAECIDVMRRLLCKDRTRRLGAGGLDDIFTHPFFEQYDRQMLEQKRVSPVFVPPSKKVNYDASFDLEEMLLEGSPLDPRMGRRKGADIRFDKVHDVSREEELYRLLDVHFHTYDFARYAKPISAPIPAAPVLSSIVNQACQTEHRSGIPVMLSKEIASSTT